MRTMVSLLNQGLAGLFCLTVALGLSEVRAQSGGRPAPQPVSNRRPAPSFVARPLQVARPTELTARQLTAMGTVPEQVRMNRERREEVMPGDRPPRRRGVSPKALPALALPEGASRLVLRRSARFPAPPKPSGPIPPPPPPGPPQTPLATTGWEATGGLSAGGWASDSQIAVSTTHIVVTSRAVLGFYNKAGKLLKFLSASDLFATASAITSGKIDSGTLFDLRAIFDPYRHRFFIGVMGSKGNLQSQFLVAVSKSENPLDGFYLYSWDAVSTEPDVHHDSDAADYPSLGVDGTVLYETNKVADSVGYRYWYVTLFDASRMAAGMPLSGSSYAQLLHQDGTVTSLIQPVVHHGPSPRGYLVSRKGDDKVVVWAITDALKPTQQIAQVEVQVAPFEEPLDGPQRDPNAKGKVSAKKNEMTNLGTTMLKAVYRDGQLYVVGNDARDWGSANDPLTSVRLLRLNVASFPAITAPAADPDAIDRPFGGANPIEDPPGTRLFYGWPAVEVNQQGDMAIVYARTGTTIFPEVRASAYFAAESDIRPSRLLRKGDGPHDPPALPETILPWGDTAGASVDPFDDTGIWLAQEYPTAKGLFPTWSNYSVWVGKLYGAQHPDLWVEECAKSLNAMALTIENQGDGPAGPTTGHLLLIAEGKETKIHDFAVKSLASGASAHLSFALPADELKEKLQIVVDPVSSEYSTANNKEWCRTEN